MYNENTYFLLNVIYPLLLNYNYFTWDYEKVRAIFEAWQAGAICRSTTRHIEEEKDDYDELEKELLNLLNKVSQ